MKTIAILTDFSPGSEHAAKYGIYLAQKIKANVALYATSPIISPVPVIAAAGWEEYDDEGPKQMSGLLEELGERLYNYMITRSFPGAFLPVINTCPDEDFITNSFLDLDEDKDIILAVMAGDASVNWGCAISTVHWREAINAATIPVLVVPRNAAIRCMEKIVFATDSSYADIGCIDTVAGMARFSTAEIMVADVTCEGVLNGAENARITRFKEEMLSNVDYGRIYHRVVPDRHGENGLEWLIENRQFDMLAMVHRNGFLSDLLFNRGMMDAMIYRKNVPVLVYPNKASF